MIVMRRVKIEVNRPKIGDRIHIGHYTATCQEIAPKGALFLLDQYLDKAYPMNRRNTNKGGYPESDLRKALQSSSRRARKTRRTTLQREPVCGLKGSRN